MSAIRTDDYDSVSFALTCIDCGEGQTRVFDDRCIDCHSDRMRAEGVAAERARVVADLRRQAHNLKGGLSRLAPDALDTAADYFERGQHDKEGA